MSGSEDQGETATVAELSLEVSRRISLSREKPELPGYELFEVLGTGAFGQVYRAKQKSTGQLVAVKVLFIVTTGFREEVSRLSRVSDHPNIVTLVDANLDFEPPFLVTPYLPHSLREHVPTDPAQVELEKVVTWFEEIAQALQFVHSRGILHCDLKPANILLGEENQARLVDFGQSVGLEGDDVRLGSFWFMPWQQARLPKDKADIPEVRWDIYALGATIYNLLTGQLPRASEAARETLSQLPTGQERLERYRELAKANSLQSVVDLNPKVDEELAAIVEGCLVDEEEPTYTSVSDVLEDLQRRRDKFPLKARALSRSYWLERFFARHRLSVVVITLALAFLLIGFAASSYEIYQTRRARQALIITQYERGQSLLENGRASGLVWLAKACQANSSETDRATLESALSRQLRIADPQLYRLRTSTAPSPSGTRVIWKDPERDNQRVLLDLTDGSTSPLAPNIRALNQNQKDTVRYALEGIVLDPGQGQGGPATWRLPPFDSVSPTNKDATLAICVRPDLVLHAIRTPEGFEVYDSAGTRRCVAKGPGSSSAPTFSRQGDLVVAWEDSRVEVYLASKAWEPKVLDSDFAGELFCFSPDGTRLAGHDGESKIRVWDREGQVLAQFEIRTAANDMAFDPSGNLLVCATRDALVHGFQVDSGGSAWSPAEMEKSALWIFVQPNGQVVTMSDEVTVWKQPEPESNASQDLPALVRSVAQITGWVYDENAQVRTLTREEYSQL